MIKISNKIFDPSSLTSQYQSDIVGKKIIDILSSSTSIYKYSSINELKFEINLRLNIIAAARELYKSDFSFRVFRKSICNEEYWNRIDEGGFLLKDGVKPSDAIKDIFIHGEKYGNECATAMVIVYYKALVDIYPENLFNEMFPKIQLMNWHYMDDDLDIRNYRNPKDYLPGDCRYFKNPEVNPLTPQWQGENTIDLGDGTYYGHGIGIRSAEKVIESLNTRRKEGATESAYLMDSATRPDFIYLSEKYSNFVSRMRTAYYRNALGNYSAYIY